MRARLVRIGFSVFNATLLRRRRLWMSLVKGVVDAIVEAYDSMGFDQKWISFYRDFIDLNFKTK